MIQRSVTGGEHDRGLEQGLEALRVSQPALLQLVFVEHSCPDLAGRCLRRPQFPHNRYACTGANSIRARIDHGPNIRGRPNPTRRFNT